MIIGDTEAALAGLKARAKDAVMRFYVGIADGDGTPPTLRAMYVRKAEQARIVKEGGTSELIAGEAAMRGISPPQMAQVIIDMAEQSNDVLELARMKANVAIEAAADESAVMTVLAGIDCPLPDQPHSA